jgi:quinol monooxygenase YgiN
VIKVVARNMVSTEKIADFIALAQELVEATVKNDEGCIHYELYQDINDPGILTFIEEWESMEALEQHMAAEHFKRIVPRLGDFTSGPEDVHLYRKAD